MAFPRIRTMLTPSRRPYGKNPTQSTLAKYNLSLTDASDIFAPKWRSDLLALFDQLPSETARCAHHQIELLDTVQDHIDQLEARILAKIKITPSIQLIQTVPGPAKVLAIIIDHEVGSIDRSPAAKNFASYSWLVPKVKASAAEAIPSPSVPPPATWRRRSIGSSKRTSPTGSPLTWIPQGRSPCLAQPRVSPYLTWIPRDPGTEGTRTGADWAAPGERTHASQERRIDVPGETG
jgi:hypothetical protein